MPVRLRSLSVKGFRAYGAGAQTLNLPGDIAVVWGPNSKGKTSLAEAFEFLLTGKIARRELMGSTQDEFADALRNAHIGDGDEVFVAARIVAANGSLHEVRRVLTSDYGKRQECESRLEIDGAPASEEDLARLGIVLSQPPLQAPVLAQHTLGHIFSVRPQDRATYFKALLEVADLDELRYDVAGLVDELQQPEDLLVASFDSCVAAPGLRPALERIAWAVPPLEKLSAKLEEAAGSLIEEAGEAPPEGLKERLAAVERILNERRSKTFYVRGFERANLAGWSAPSTDIWSRLDGYVAERGKVDEETRRLAALFEEALKLPAVADISGPVDCPLCGTASALSPERVELIRQHVENTREFKKAESAAKTALSELVVSAKALASAADSALPRYLKTNGAKRRAAGFTVARIRELLGEAAAGLVPAWLAQVRPLLGAAKGLRKAGLAVAAVADHQVAHLADLAGSETLRTAFGDLEKARIQMVAAVTAYETPARTLERALQSVIDAQEGLAVWQDFLTIAREPEKLRAGLIDRRARSAVAGELDAALKEIDRAKEKVLDDKFTDHSGAIQQWWERLRPDEHTFFSAVQPRKGAKRTIDLKAGLSANPDRSAPKMRDVVAVFSQSQLHCLGLALFLARAEREGLGFIILDDPVLSSDEDYRVHFNATVLSELLKLPMQVIIMTQDHDTWEELETRYRHARISTAQLFIETPAAGSIIENTSDALLAKISRARSLARGGHPDSRKECGVQLRDAGERFCKELLVKDRRGKGEATASLTDYDGKTLEWLSPRVEPLLDQDPSHPGKFEVFRKTVNDACHDNAPPGTAAMTQACGEISFLQQKYLPR